MASLDRSAQLLGPRDAVSQCLGETTEKMVKIFFFFWGGGGGEKSPKKLKRNNKGLELGRFWLVEKLDFWICSSLILKLVDGVTLDIQTPKLRFGMTGP